MSEWSDITMLHDVASAAAMLWWQASCVDYECEQDS